MAINPNLNFHQTFKPERKHLASIIDIADGSTIRDIKEISAQTGIPNGKSSGKVEPHICYASYMGLIESQKKDGKYLLTRTDLGNLVISEDPGIQENLTILLCHAMMLRKNTGADMWEAVFKAILPKYKTGTNKEIVQKELEQQFEGKANAKNYAPFLSSYEDFFAPLNILSLRADSISCNPLPYDKEFVFLYAFILWEYWDIEFAGQDEITSNQLGDLCFRKAFGWDEQQEYVALEHMADKGMIRLNRQLMPYTLLKLVDKDALLERLYSELC